MKESQNNNALVAIYQIQQIDQPVLDSLKKYGYDRQVLHNEYWVEKLSREKPRYIFLHPRTYGTTNHFRYNDILIADCENWRKWLKDARSLLLPIISLLDSNAIDRVSAEKHHLQEVGETYLPYQIPLYLYWITSKDHSHQSHLKNISLELNDNLLKQYIGKLILMPVEGKDTYQQIDPNSAWESLCFLPVRRKRIQPCYIGDIVKDDNGNRLKEE